MEFTKAFEADYQNIAERKLVESPTTVQRDTLHQHPASQSPTNGRVPISRGTPKSTDGESSQGLSEQRFACDVPGCGVACKREADLQRHKNYKHGLGPLAFECDVCNYASRRKDKMIEHQKATSHSYRTIDVNQSQAT
jgi:hypothetical protein